MLENWRIFVYLVLIKMIQSLRKCFGSVRGLNKMRSRRKLFLFLVAITITAIAYYFKITYFENGMIKKGVRYFDLSKNYLRPLNSSIFQNGFLVDNSKCRIPNINIWNDELQSFWDKPRLNLCSEKKRDQTIEGLTFVRKQSIIINENKLQSLGLDFNRISCCYRTIERVQQNTKSYNRSADSIYKFSDNCHAMVSVETSPISGFTQVTCEQKGWFWDSPLHIEFHLLASFQQQFQSVNGSGKSLHEKLKFWKENTHHPRPPNVLLLGIDATSRNNFHRMMPMSMGVLGEQFEAVEMSGYTKVGINTFPNFVPLISSYSVDELQSVCLPSWSSLQDDCPYMWKNFSARNYLTAHIEDTPAFAIFHYQKTGFVDQPVDIYPRPWMLASYEKDPSLCLEGLRPDQIVLRYVVDLIELAESHGIPYFITVWMTQLTHFHMNHLRHMDVPMRDALLALKEGGSTRNSVLVVVGDHGYRYSADRRTFSGFFEDKLPTLWISLPVSLKTQLPKWRKNLRHNSRQLVTPFDVHETLKHVLNVERRTYLPVNKSGRGLLRGRSLFTKVPTRTCGEAGVPDQYCACSSPEELKGDVQSVVKMATVPVLSRYNTMLPSPDCIKLEIDHIRALAVVRVKGPNPQQGNITSNNIFSDATRSIIIGVKTTPGNMELEAMLRYNGTTRAFELVDVLQSSSIGGNDDCVPKGADSSICYCKEKSLYDRVSSMISSKITLKL